MIGVIIVQCRLKRIGFHTRYISTDDRQQLVLQWRCGNDAKQRSAAMRSNLPNNTTTWCGIEYWWTFSVTIRHSYCRLHKSAGLAYHSGNCIRLRKLRLHVTDLADLRCHTVYPGIIIIHAQLSNMVWSLDTVFYISTSGDTLWNAVESKEYYQPVGGIKVAHV